MLIGRKTPLEQKHNLVFLIEMQIYPRYMQNLLRKSAESASAVPESPIFIETQPFSAAACNSVHGIYGHHRRAPGS
jgi:hypothetical protein